MTAPYTAPRAAAPVDTVPPKQPVAPPPNEVPLVVQIAEILLAAYALKKTIDLVAALLAPYRVSRAAVQYALGLATDAHKPYAILSDGVTKPTNNAAAELVRATARNDVYYRAAYVAKASARMQNALNDGKPLAEVLSTEAAYFEAHRRARRRRIDVAANVANAASLYGPLLGWYRNWMLDSDPDCRLADGHNFYAAQGTVIGLPGAVHPNCGCHAGPPHESGAMVNTVLSAPAMKLAPSVVPVQAKRRAS